jgi:hypothetical protein
MKQSEVLDMITKIQLAHQAMESAWKRVDELKEENKNLKEALAKQEQGDWVGLTDEELSTIEYEVYGRTLQKGKPMIVFIRQFAKAIESALKEKNSA